jgi:hypothetical protein
MPQPPIVDESVSLLRTNKNSVVTAVTLRRDTP